MIYKNKNIPHQLFFSYIFQHPFSGQYSQYSWGPMRQTIWPVNKLFSAQSFRSVWNTPCAVILFFVRTKNSHLFFRRVIAILHQIIKSLSLQHNLGLSEMSGWYKLCSYRLRYTVWINLYQNVLSFAWSDIYCTVL